MRPANAALRHGDERKLTWRDVERLHFAADWLDQAPGDLPLPHHTGPAADEPYREVLRSHAGVLRRLAQRIAAVLPPPE
jgi:hypothetical protein